MLTTHARHTTRRSLARLSRSESTAAGHDIDTPPRNSAEPAKPVIAAISPRTYPLAGSTFAIGTSGYAVAGLVPALSAELHVTPATAGQLLTVTALTCAIAGPVAIVATRYWDRRRLLVAALLTVGLGNTFAAVAPTFGLLIVARVITAAGMAAVTPTAVASAAAMNEPDVRARSMAVAFAGLPLALVLGVPASNALESLGFRGTLGLIAGLCVVAASSVRLLVPASSGPKSSDAVALPPLASISHRRVLAVLAVSLLATCGTFVVYTYIAPLLSTVTSATGATMSGLLVAYGLGAIAGNAAGGRAADRHGPRRALIVALAACTVALAAIPVLAGTVPGATAVLAVWGFAFWSISAPVTAALTQIAPAQAGVLLSLNASAVYAGMSLGGLCGGLIVSWSGVSLLPIVAAIVAGCSCIVAIWIGPTSASTSASGRRRLATSVEPFVTTARLLIRKAIDHVR